MKHTAQSEYVTKQDLKEAFKEFGKEFKKELVKELLTAIDARINIKLEALEYRIDDRARKYNSEILNRFDAWAGTLETAGIEGTITSNKLIKLGDKVAIHEKRIKKLEKN